MAFNTGHYLGAPRTHIILNTDEREAIWFSAAGTQLVRLEADLTRPISNLQALPDWITAGNPSAAPNQA